MKVTYSKVIAGGESILIELDDVESWSETIVAEAFKIADLRLFEMNRRVLALNEMYQKLAKKFPKAAIMVNDIILELTGQKVFEDKTVAETAAFVAANPKVEERTE